MTWTATHKLGATCRVSNEHVLERLHTAPADDVWCTDDLIVIGDWTFRRGK